MNVPLMFNNLHIENEPVNIPLPYGITLTIKREDKNHPFVSGNKLRKLKYNIAKAQEEGKDTRAKYFITVNGEFLGFKKENPELIRKTLMEKEKMLVEQLKLFNI